MTTCARVLCATKKVLHFRYTNKTLKHKVCEYVNYSCIVSNIAHVKLHMHDNVVLAALNEVTSVNTIKEFKKKIRNTLPRQYRK
jgi:hypothetical protein